MNAFAVVCSIPPAYFFQVQSCMTSILMSSLQFTCVSRLGTIVIDNGCYVLIENNN